MKETFPVSNFNRLKTILIYPYQIQRFVDFVVKSGDLNSYVRKRENKLDTYVLCFSSSQFFEPLTKALNLDALYSHIFNLQL